jgi:hypothetical protein
MAAPLLAAGITGGASVLGSLIGNIGSKKRQKRADQANIKFWRMQNAYNDPAQQMSRLKKAGLNPNLIYGQSVSGATGQAGAVAPSKAAPYSMDLGGAANNALAAYQTQAQVENTNVNTLREMEKLDIDKKFLEPMAKVELQKMALGNIKQYLDNQQLAPFVATAAERATEELLTIQENTDKVIALRKVAEFQAELADLNISPTGNIMQTLLRMAVASSPYLMELLGLKFPKPEPKK